MTNYYNCPNCEQEIEVLATDKEVECSRCDKVFIVDHDAEFENGVWKDLTSLYPK